MGYIQKQYRDITIIPDKYNTGCDETLLTPCIDEPGVMQDFYWGFYSAGAAIGISFSDPNNTSKIGTTITISNVDFTNYIVRSFNNDNVDVDTKFIFNNCKFNEVTLDGNEHLQFEINDSTIVTSNFSYADLNRCRIGGSYNDGTRSFGYTTFNDCYICDLCYWDGTGNHTDGIQIYGRAGLDCNDIILNNCRFEGVTYPVYKDGVPSSAYVNACIMLQLEFADGDNIQFNNCVVNGGNFSCYSWVKPQYQSDHTLTNAEFNSCQFGYSDNTGVFYYTIDPNTTITNCFSTNKLYISSVWKDSNNEVHISVTNDTLVDRILWVRTDSGYKKYYIPHSYTEKLGFDKYHPGDDFDFSNYPIDIDINVGDTDYVVCYDDSVHHCNQIRFVSFDENNVEEVTVDEPCRMDALYNRYRNLLPPTDPNGIVYYNPLWEQQTSVTGQSILEFGNVSNGHTYKITGEITYSVDTDTEQTSAAYFRLRTMNDGCFAMISIVLDKLTLNSGVVTKTVSFEQTLTATKNGSFGKLNILADLSLPYTFSVSNIRIKDIS